MDTPGRIDDLVVLGRAAPEPIADGRHTVCLGGYSETVGYVRLYPTQQWMDQCARWNVVSVPVESAAPEDTRDESYKIQGSKEDWDTLSEKIEKVGQLTKSEQIQLVDRLAGDCTRRLNEQRKSLGMVRPDEIRNVYLESNPDPTTQVTLDGTERKGKRDYAQKLYLEYECENCDLKGTHDQHCIEWGVYRYWDKHDDPKGVVDALGLNDPDRHHYFFVGNLSHQRRAFIIISDLRFTEEQLREAGVRPDTQASLGDY